MVMAIPRLMVGIISCLLAQDPLTVESIQIRAESPVRVLPCEPIYIPFDVTVKGAISPAGLLRVANQLAEHTRIDGVSYRNVLANSEANEVVGVIVDDSPGTPTQEEPGQYALRVVVMMFWNFRDGDCTFYRTGAHMVSLEPYCTFNVKVEESSSVDQKLVRTIRDKSNGLYEFILDPLAMKDRDVVGFVGDLLSQNPGSSYRDILSVSVGLKKLAELRPEQGRDIQTLLAERVAIGRQYLLPALENGVDSPIEALGGYTFVRDVVAMSKIAPEKDNKSQPATLGEAREAALKVRDSNVSLQYRSLCAKQLEGIEHAMDLGP